MNIESIEVIPSRKESIFEDTDPVIGNFDCSFTTSYDEWKDAVVRKVLDNSYNNGAEYDDECMYFAQSQKAYMTSPVAIFGKTVYMAKAVKFDNVNDLYAMSNTGPLYHVFSHMVDDLNAEKTVERTYVCPITFQKKFGKWYPQKKEYMLRFGVVDGR